MRRPVRPVLLALAATALAAPPAYATFPGSNGDLLLGVRTQERTPVEHTMTAVPGGAPTDLAGGSGGSLPHVSPDGTRLTYARSTTHGNQGAGDVYISNRDGSGEVNLTDVVGTDTAPQFSPDGTRIAFASENGEVVDEPIRIYTMKLDGTDKRAVSPATWDGLAPTYTPDGRIVYVAKSPPNDIDAVGDLRIVNADGTGDAALTNTAADEGAPDVSPDGTKLIFSADYSILTRPLAGGSTTTILQALPIPQDPCCYFEPVWSPDGTKVAAFRTPDNNRSEKEAIVANADGSSPVAVTPALEVTGLTWVANPATTPPPGGGGTTPPPGGGTTPPPGGGTTAPGAIAKAVTIGGKAKQKDGGANLKLSTSVTAPATGPVTATVSGSITIKGTKKKIALAKGTRTVAAGQTGTVVVKLKGSKKARKKAAKKIKAALKKGRRVTASLKIVITEAGGATDTRTRKVRLTK